MNKRLLLFAALALAAPFVSGCSSDTQLQHTGYSGYSGGTGMASQNVQTNSPLPGPRYYQSTDNPYH
jgi:hypothetical protein